MGAGETWGLGAKGCCRDSKQSEEGAATFPEGLSITSGNQGSSPWFLLSRWKQEATPVTGDPLLAPGKRAALPGAAG